MTEEEIWHLPSFLFITVYAPPKHFPLNVFILRPWNAGTFLK